MDEGHSEDHDDLKDPSEFGDPIDSKASKPPGNNVPATLRSGDIVGGKYKIVSPLGSGGMGTVYRVNHLFLQKDFALKTLNKRNMSAETVRRFHQEAKAAGALNHPNLVRVSDFGLMDDQRPFLVMELVSGTTLSNWVEINGPLDWELAVITLVELCKGLGFAHSKEIIHRDIKPSNIILDWPDPANPTEDSVKIVDFGIAKLSAHEGGEIQGLTQTGEIFGSPMYMSPEQATGQKVDCRTDIYSAGCVLFYALTGSPPFVGESALQTMRMHQYESPPTIGQAAPQLEFPDELETLIKKMLAKNPADRFQDMAQVVSELNEIVGTISGSDNASSTAIETEPGPSIEDRRANSNRTRQFVYAMVCFACLILIVMGTARFLQTPEDQDMRSEGSWNIENGEYQLIGNWRPQDFARLAKVSPRKVSLKNANSVVFSGLTHLNESNIQELTLQRTPITDDDLKYLAGIKTLNTLNLSRTSITGRSIKALRGLKNLSSLNLDYTNVDRQGLRTVCQLNRLILLSVMKTKLSLTDLSMLKNLEKLHYLNASFLGLGNGDAGEVLSQLSTLEELLLQGTGFGDREVSALTALPLVKLNVTGCPLTDRSLVYLAEIKTLKGLDLTGCTGLSNDAIKLLRKQRPDVHITETPGLELQKDLDQFDQKRQFYDSKRKSLEEK